MKRKVTLKERAVKFFLMLLILLILALTVIFTINGYVKISSKDNILKEDEIKNADYDCIIVLGAGVWGDRPSHMLEDRLLTGVFLYEKGYSDRLLMSGDHGSKDYDEVNVMKRFAIDKGVPSENIFMDHAGFSTYESLYRAKEIFLAKKVIIVTQEYHLHRAIYIADKLGVEAVGVSADLRPYVGQEYREAREVLARIKDFFYCLLKPLPTYLGDTIPVSGNGDLTNDK